MSTRLSDPEWRALSNGHATGALPHWLDDHQAEERDEKAHNEAWRLPAAWIGWRLCGVGVCVGKQPLLSDIDLEVYPGEVAAVLGPNGAGKSTLMSVLAGLRVPASGEVSLGGRALHGIKAEQLAMERAVMQQDSAVAFDFSVREVVELGRYPHRLLPSTDEAGIVNEAMALTDVSHLADRTINSLSGGERARTQLARVLAQIWHPLSDGQPRWLLLDEPTAALDLHHQHLTLNTVRRWAREHGVGVVAVLHDLNLALRYADRVWVLGGGRLQASGAPAATLTPALLREIWRVDAHTWTSADGCSHLLITSMSEKRS